MYSLLINQEWGGFRIMPADGDERGRDLCVFQFSFKVREEIWDVVSRKALIYTVFYCIRKL
jgi:hypothetical protein